MTETNQNITTWYPGIGSDKATRELNELVGQITANWAEVEDGLFHIFLVALNGTFLAGDLRPFRAVFFTFGAYESKMRMTDNAMKTRFADQQGTLGKWQVLKQSLDRFASLRNKVAHLVPYAKSTPDPEAPANVRLMPPFWKSGPSNPDEFDTTGYSVDELWQALAPYWGFDPRIRLPGKGDEVNRLGLRVQKFAMEIDADPRVRPRYLDDRHAQAEPSDP